LKICSEFLNPEAEDVKPELCRARAFSKVS